MADDFKTFTLAKCRSTSGEFLKVCSTDVNLYTFLLKIKILGTGSNGFVLKTAQKL